MVVCWFVVFLFISWCFSLFMCCWLGGLRLLDACGFALLRLLFGLALIAILDA